MTFGWSPLHKGHACSFNFTLLGWHFGELRGCLKMGDCSHLGPLQPSLQGKEHHSTWSIEHRAARAQTPAQSHLTSSGSSRCRLGLAHRPWTALCFRGCLFLGQNGMIRGITHFLPTFHARSLVTSTSHIPLG